MRQTGRGWCCVANLGVNESSLPVASMLLTGPDVPALWYSRSRLLARGKRSQWPSAYPQLGASADKRDTRIPRKRKHIAAVSPRSRELNDRNLQPKPPLCSERPRLLALFISEKQSGPPLAAAMNHANAMMLSHLTAALKSSDPTALLKTRCHQAMIEGHL